VPERWRYDFNGFARTLLACRAAYRIFGPDTGRRRSFFLASAASSAGPVRDEHGPESVMVINNSGIKGQVARSKHHAQPAPEGQGDPHGDEQQVQPPGEAQPAERL